MPQWGQKLSAQPTSSGGSPTLSNGGRPHVAPRQGRDARHQGWALANARPGCKLLTIWPAMAASLSFLVPRQHRWTSDCLGCSHFLAPC